MYYFTLPPRFPRHNGRACSFRPSATQHTSLPHAFMPPDLPCFPPNKTMHALATHAIAVIGVLQSRPYRAAGLHVLQQGLRNQRRQMSRHTDSGVHQRCTGSCPTTRVQHEREAQRHCVATAGCGLLPPAGWAMREHSSLSDLHGTYRPTASQPAARRRRSAPSLWDQWLEGGRAANTNRVPATGTGCSEVGAAGRCARA